jgi:hypothetical protein
VTIAPGVVPFEVPTPVWADDAAVYVSTLNALLRAPLDGGAASVFADGGAWSVAGDECNVYWAARGADSPTTFADAVVYRAAKLAP